MNDVLAVLGKVLDHKRSDIQQARIAAVEMFANEEHQTGRFKNFRSAKNSITDALGRRFGRRSLADTDALLALWLEGHSQKLERALLNECRDSEQEEQVRAFFRA